MKGVAGLLALCPACVAAAGPVVSYGPSHGWSGGAEVSAGLALPLQVAAGADGNSAYLRGDVIVETAGLFYPEWGTGARLGGGIGSTHGDRYGVFASGASVGAVLQRSSSCDGGTIVGSLWLDLRYRRGWEIAFAPRIQALFTGCPAF